MYDKKSAPRPKGEWTQGGGRSRPKPDKAPVKEKEIVLVQEKKAQVDIVKVESAVVAPPIITLPEKACDGCCEVLGMAYVRRQKWEGSATYEPELGLERGTIFPDLDYPFVGEGACRYE